MVKIKEGFKGERLVSLPEELLASYRREPLINNLYVRKIGFFPRVKYHFLQKEHGCDYAMLIYCTEGKDGIVSSVNNIPWRNTNISSSLPVSPTHSGQTREIHGLFTGYTSKGSFAINSCRRIRFRSLFCRMNIPVYKIGYGCLRRYIAVSPWDILKNI